MRDSDGRYVGRTGVWWTCIGIAMTLWIFGCGAPQTTGGSQETKAEGDEMGEGEASGQSDQPDQIDPIDQTGEQADADGESSTDMTPIEDPHQWLEEIQGEKALAWVEARNEESTSVLTADPRFDDMRAHAESVLDAKDKIPYGTMRGDYIYNFWRDDEHVRGLWRRIPSDAYLSEDSWEPVIDVDALAEKEDENWVWKGATCRAPAFDRCLVHLSRGGKDAAVRREFSLESRSFIEDGFEIPEAKGHADWLDEDTLLVASDFGEGTMTESGYPRTIRLWKRGTELDDAEVIFEGAEKDVGSWPWVHQETDGERIVMLDRSTTFYSGEYHLASPDDPARQLRIPLPDDVRPQAIFDGHLVSILRSPWTVDGTTIDAGAVVAVDLAPYRAVLDGDEPLPEAGALPTPTVEALVVPDEHTAVQRVQTTRDAVIVGTLVDVKPRLLRYTKGDDGAWSHSPIELPSEIGISIVIDASPYERDIYIRHENPIQPQSLYRRDGETGALEELAVLPARFDATGMKVAQHWATSEDGTKVPYFVVLPEGWTEDQPRPTYLYGYGGFEHSMLPYYRALTGKFWLENGGVFALANIRGGGEYGPRWHQAALLKHRQRAFDDFHAVAEDLIARNITSPDQLGIHGGSNGGLLVGVAVTQRPELYGAAIIDVPLLDMMRYDKLLAGASWVGEYGDPDDPEMRDVLLAYSPYHNVEADETYPRVFLTTSTLDDRVHPGHARKMVARMLEQEHPLYYYENTEGGHGGVANNKQAAFMHALKFVYLLRELGLGEPAEASGDTDAPSAEASDAPADR